MRALCAGCWMLAFSVFATEKPVLVPKVCPTPVCCEISATNYVPLNVVTLACDDACAVTWVREHLEAWYGEEVREGRPCDGRSKSEEVRVNSEKVEKGICNIHSPTPTLRSNSSESYRLVADAQGVRIVADSLAGTRWAMQTLRQLAIPARGTAKVEGWIIPVCTIEDHPAMAFRGMHVCWFPETAEWQVERLIRLAGAYKMNHVVLEPWGTFDSKVASWYAWSGKAKMTREALVRLRTVAADLGVTLVPQLNVFGHASMSRVVTGKHAALDFHPEYQPLFEPVGGWNWCLSNPETRKLLVALIGELCEAFGNPPYFHLGCDEANPPSCPDCMKRPYSEILLEHIRAMNDAVTAHGARAMMWHDQLLERGDARWKGFYAYGTSETAAAAAGLPKDIVICDWHYGEKKADYPTMRHFKDLGFSVVTCPWQDKDGIAAQGVFAQTNGLFGVMGTYWHHFHGQTLPTIAVSTACAAWGTPVEDFDQPANNVRFMNDLRRIGWDMMKWEGRACRVRWEEKVKVRGEGEQWDGSSLWEKCDYDRTGVYMRQTVSVSEEDD